MSKAKKISILTIGQGINILVNLLFMPYMARALSYEENGTYGQVVFIVAFAVILLSLGLPQIVNVYLSDEKYSKKQIYSASLLASLILGIIGCLFLYTLSAELGSYLKNPKLVPLLKIYSVSIIFQGAGLIINTFLVFEGKIKTSIILILATNVLKIIFVTFSIQFYQSLELAFIFMSISHFLYFTLGVLITSKMITAQVKKYQIIEQIKYGFPLGVTYLVGMGIIYTDSIMVSKYLGVKEYAIYRNGAIEVPFISSIYGSISAIIMPEVAKLWNNNELTKLVELKNKVIKNSIYFIYPILIFLLFHSTSIITLYLGENYSSSAIIFSIYNVSLLFRVNDFSDILIASKNGKIILTYYIMIFALNILLNLILIYFWGAAGAAVSSMLCIFFLAILQLRKTIQITNNSLSHFIDLKQIIWILCFSWSILFVIDLLFNFVTNDLFKLMLIAIFYFTIVYFYFLNKIDFPQSIINNKYFNKIYNVRTRH